MKFYYKLSDDQVDALRKVLDEADQSPELSQVESIAYLSAALSDDLDMHLTRMTNLARRVLDDQINGRLGDSSFESLSRELSGAAVGLLYEIARIAVLCKRITK